MIIRDRRLHTKEQFVHYFREIGIPYSISRKLAPLFVIDYSGKKEDDVLAAALQFLASFPKLRHIKVAAKEGTMPDRAEYDAFRIFPVITTVRLSAIALKNLNMSMIYTWNRSRYYWCVRSSPDGPIFKYRITERVRRQLLHLYRA